MARFVLGPTYRFSDVSTSPAYHAEYLPAMVAFLLIIVPFYHGANRYLDQTYVFQKVPIKPFTLLVDFFVLFLEAMIFYWMALRLTEWETFFSLLLVLLVVDIVWIIFVYFYSQTFSDVKKWGLINTITVCVMAIFLYTPLLPNEIKPAGLAILTSIRTLVDYILNWNFFYPKRESGGNTND